MYLYIIFTLLSVLAIMEVCHIRIKGVPNFYEISFCVILIVVFLLSTLRWENGTDWNTYYDYFSYVGKNLDSAYMEPGFSLLCYFDYKYFNYTLHLGVIAFLCIVPIAIRIKQFSPFPILSLLIWFSVSFAHMFPVRQTVAVSLFVFSWKFINERKFLQFIFTTAIAATFHLTVLITVPVYFLWRKYIQTKVYILIIGVVFIISIAVNQLFGNALLLMGNIGGGIIEAKLSAYIENSEEAFGSAYSPLQILVRGCVNRTIYFLIPLILIGYRRKHDRVLNAVFNMYFYSFLLFLIFTPFSIALGRLASYTDIAQTFLLPFLFTVKMNRTNIIAIAMITLFYFAVRFDGVISNYRDLYIPYHSVLFK